jgi:hypothetical protein
MVYSIPVRSIISASNNTTSALTGATAFTGTGEDVTRYAQVSTFVRFTSATGTLQGLLSLEFSTDNSNWDRVYTTVVSESQTVIWRKDVPAQYARVVFTNQTNGTSGNQTAMRLQTRFHAVSDDVGNPFTSVVNSSTAHADLATNGTFSGKYEDIEHMRERTERYDKSVQRVATAVPIAFPVSERAKTNSTTSSPPRRTSRNHRHGRRSFSSAKNDGRGP